MTEGPRRVQLPLSDEDLHSLRAGDSVLLNGPIYGARDAAHLRMYTLIQESRESELPFSLAGAGVYYVGPTPAPEGRPIGSAGPTTSTRMDAYTPALVERGLRAMVGKGRRSQAVKDAMVQHGAVYFAAIGGAGALLAQHIVSAQVVAYADLGTEAVREYTLQDFPCIVVTDTTGTDLYEIGPAAYAGVSLEPLVVSR